jgi:DNA processing protein
VGSRRASYYGLSNAERFAGELAACGFTIVSGMARGIDTYAHRGALKSGGRTIAVMGSGFNHIYPEENQELCEEISQQGVVISEFPIDIQPAKQNFPRRNRIISGLSLGVLVAEAAKNSGALITSDFALEQGRDVFALPGKIDSPHYFGTNGLIKQGAKLVSSVEDILEEFSFVLNKNNELLSKEQGMAMGPKEQTQSLSCAETRLYNIITNCPLTIDEIMEKTSLNISELSNMLFKLQIKKIIKQLPGRQFVRSEDAG